jgi:hypothetical protein
MKTSARNQLCGVGLVAAGQKHRMGPVEPTDRFAQQASGQQMTVAPGASGIDQHQVEIAGKPAVLEAIVEQQQLTFQLVYSRFADLRPVRPL